MAADINKAAAEIEAFLGSYETHGASPRSFYVRPSGDDVDVIKVWVDLGTATIDPNVWAMACEAAINKAVPASASFRVAVRVESDR